MLTADLFAFGCLSPGLAHAARTVRARASGIADAIVSFEADATEGHDSAPDRVGFGIGLTAIELTVIALAHSDPVSSVKPRSRLFQTLFGPRSGLALANPRLEALRRYVVLFRWMGAPPGEASLALCDAGYNRRQIEAIDARITLPHRRRGIWTWLLRTNSSPAADQPQTD